MNFEQELKEKIKCIDTALENYLEPRANLQNVIYEAMRYSIFAGGKRLRPVIMLAVCEMCGGNSEAALPFACAMEMIHTYSLIHDDLPAMDNDTMRRGRPTSHIQFDEATAVLAGDALLNRAFEIMTDRELITVDADTALRAAHVIALSSGTEGMIGGQIVDIDSETKVIDRKTLQYIHSLKTGAIIRSSAAAGAILAKAGEDERRRADEFAYNLGIAFQIQDDILDVEGDSAVLGKPVGSDAENHKNTYVSLYGIEQAKILVREYLQKAENALSYFGTQAAFLKDLTAHLIGRKA